MITYAPGELVIIRAGATLFSGRHLSHIIYHEGLYVRMSMLGLYVDDEPIRAAFVGDGWIDVIVNDKLVHVLSTWVTKAAQ